MPPAKIESAGDISKRYGLAGLVRARMMARRLALNAMARRMSTSMQDSIELFYPDLVPLESELLSSRNYLLALDQPEDSAVSRSALPAYETRLYNRRLAEMETITQEANDRADRVLDRYITRSRARAAILDGNLQDGDEDEDRETRRMVTRSTDAAKHTKDDTGKNRSETSRNEGTAEEDEEVNELLEDAYENNYLDLMDSPYDRPLWRRASRRLLRRRLLPYTFRPLAATNRMLARRGLL